MVFKNNSHLFCKKNARWKGFYYKNLFSNVIHAPFSHYFVQFAYFYGLKMAKILQKQWQISVAILGNL